MKFRIIRIDVGAQNPTYEVMRKYWYGWKTLGGYSGGTDGYSGWDAYQFNSIADAQFFITKWHPATRLVVKEIVIK
jgi:hypothetical protein